MRDRNRHYRVEIVTGNSRRSNYADKANTQFLRY